MDDDKSDVEEGDERGTSPVIEWIASAIGAVLILAVLGVIVFDAVFGDHTPPDLVAEVIGDYATTTGHTVQVRVSNLGHDAAAAVRVEGRLGADEEPETAQFLLEFVPGGSEREGALIFSRAPAGDLSVRVTGYRQP